MHNQGQNSMLGCGQDHGPQHLLPGQEGGGAGGFSLANHSRLKDEDGAI